MALPSALAKESKQLEADLEAHFNAPPETVAIDKPVMEPIAQEPVFNPGPIEPVTPEPEPRHIDGLGEFSGQKETVPDWEQKFKSLDGRLKKDNETSRVSQDENADLRLQVEQLQREAKNNRAKADAGAYLTSEQREEFDDEQIAMAASVAQGVVNPAVDELRGEVKALREILSESQIDHTAQLKETFTRELLRLIPEWYELNDPRNMATLGFREWLHEIDPSTGDVRIDIINRACRRRETERVAWWVNQWKQTNGISTSPANVAPISSLVEPRGSNGSAIETEPGKPTFTVKNAKERYEDIARRLTSGRVKSDERINLQKELDDLDRAFAEGRVFDPSTRIV